MLQQTQVERVLPIYKHFIKKFPTAKKLAAAPLGEVLKSWQGLGYNRRAKMLHEAAKVLARKNLQLSSYRTDLVDALEELPGVGPYTARAVAAFAFNQDVIVIETNIRTAILHHFFTRGAGKASSRSAPAARRRGEVPEGVPILLLVKTLQAPRVSDAEIAKVLEKLLPKGRSREWYSALMDYGAYLKKSGVKLNAQSVHHAKQKKFAGSNREARGAILRELSAGEQLESHLLRLLGVGRSVQLRAALAALALEGLIQRHGHYVGLPQNIAPN